MSASKRARQSSRGASQSGSKKKVKGAADYSLEEDIANILRSDCVRSVHVTKSGHPTSCASIAEVFSVLFFHQSGLKFHSNHPSHFLNDRLVLSKGHAAPILYSALYRAGVLTQEQLMSLRKKDALLEGHPVPKIPFVDVATGSLGQGLSVAAGMAYSSKYFDKIDNRVFCVTGDGEIAEGSIWEAVDFARTYQLNNLTMFVDINRLGQSQATMLQHNMKVYESKFAGFGWAVHVIDGHNVAEIVNALTKMRKQTEKPTVILCKTFKGKNLGEKIEDHLDWHGKDLGDSVEEVIANLKGSIRNENIEFKTFAPEGDQPDGETGLVQVKPAYSQGTKISTRKAYGNGLTKARDSNPNVVSLDGDTKNSTFAITLKNKHPDSFVECFIAEQNLVGVATGLSCRRKIPFCSTFAAFFSRAADQIRIAGIGSNPINMVGSHSGVSIGEDGPSQMALEDLGFFRNIPKGVVIVPSDGVSAEKAVELVGNYRDGPAFVRTSRPDVPLLYANDEQFQLGKCKTIKRTEEDKVVIFSYGVTLHECIKATKQQQKVRIVDLFSLKPLDKDGIREHVQACSGNVLVVEQHYEAGGAYEAICGVCPEEIKKIKQLCVTKIPSSAKPAEQLEIQGLDAESILKQVKVFLQ